MSTKQRHVIAMRRLVRQIGGGIDPGEGAEIVDEVRLIEVAAIQRDIGPFHALAAFHSTQGLLEAANAAKHFGRESGFIAKHLDESLGTESDLIRDACDSGPLRLGHKTAQCEPHSGVTIEASGEFG